MSNLKLLLLSLCIASVASAATINAAGCSSAQVQTAINSATDGDTVAVPACSSGNTWNTDITMSGKAVKVEGAGIGLTNIVLSNGTFSMTGNSAGGNVGTLGGMTFSGTGSANGWISVNSSFKFRIHHLAIGQISNRTIEITGSYGLIDHMQFTGTTGYNAVQVLGGQFTPTGRWSEAMAWGADQGQNAVYIEDSTYSLTNCVTGLGTFDGFNGSKIVFRHNSVTNWQTYVHGYDSATESALQTDIYSNTFDMAKTNCAIDRMIFIRGGTGYVHDNTMHLTDAFNNYSPKLISLYYYRDSVAQQGSVCNGSAGVDQNLSGQNGYMCFQQPGAGGPGPFTSVPWYEYNNVGTGNMPANLDITNESTHVQLNRDYFNNTQRPGYVAYTYPHPLQGGAGPTSPLTQFSGKITTSGKAIAK